MQLKVQEKVFLYSSSAPLLPGSLQFSLFIIHLTFNLIVTTHLFNDSLVPPLKQSGCSLSHLISLVVSHCAVRSHLHLIRVLSPHHRFASTARVQIPGDYIIITNIFCIFCMFCIFSRRFSLAPNCKSCKNVVILYVIIPINNFSQTLVLVTDAQQ